MTQMPPQFNSDRQALASAYGEAQGRPPAGPNTEEACPGCRKLAVQIAALESQMQHVVTVLGTQVGAPPDPSMMAPTPGGMPPGAGAPAPF